MIRIEVTDTETTEWSEFITLSGERIEDHKEEVIEMLDKVVEHLKEYKKYLRGEGCNKLKAFGNKYK